MKNKFAEAVRNAVEQTTGKIFAVFCVALVNECEWKPEDAEYLCECTQAYWEEIAKTNVDVFSWCEEETGIDMRNYLTKKRKQEENFNKLKKYNFERKGD